MTKEQFLKKLEKGLKNLPATEKEEALLYYEEYFADSPQAEQEVIESLGNPRQVACQIMAQSKVNETETLTSSPKKSVSAILAVILAIFAIPIGVPVLAAIAIIVLALLIVVYAVILSLFIAGIAMVISAVASVILSLIIMFVHFPTGLATVGLSLVCFGIGVLFLFVAYYANKGFVKGLIYIAKKLMGGNKNEKNQ